MNKSKISAIEKLLNINKQIPEYKPGLLVDNCEGEDIYVKNNGEVINKIELDKLAEDYQVIIVSRPPGIIETSELIKMYSEEYKSRIANNQLEVSKKTNDN
jgi:hypothetical protein